MFVFQGAAKHDNVRLALTLTAEQESLPPGMTTFSGRINAAMIQQVLQSSPACQFLQIIFKRCLVFYRQISLIMSCISDKLCFVAVWHTCNNGIFACAGHANLALVEVASESYVFCFLQVCPDVSKREVFQCGPDTMMDSVMKELLSLGLSSSQVHQESFSF